jgi:uroporphyrinogen-III synthase
MRVFSSNFSRNEIGFHPMKPTNLFSNQSNCFNPTNWTDRIPSIATTHAFRRQNNTFAAVAADQSTGATAASTSRPQVVLTREAGKNGKIIKMLESRGICCLEMPLIETAKGPDTDRLPEALQHSEDYDWVCITSPEAASVFLKGWREAGKPKVRIAVVGQGTGKIFVAAGEEALFPQFTPTVANAEHFGPELPFIPGGTKQILYPASNKASSLLQQGLLARGFQVERLNTYDTLPVTSLAPEQLKAARTAQVVAVASPSAVRAWVGFVGEETATRIAVACIGSTSARTAESLGLKKIFYPAEPGLDTFASTIEEALASGTEA